MYTQLPKKGEHPQFSVRVCCGQTARWIKMPLLGGELGPYLTQSCLGRGLPPYQVTSYSIQPFGHNGHGPKIGGLCPFWGRRSWVSIRDVNKTFFQDQDQDFCFKTKTKTKTFTQCQVIQRQLQAMHLTEHWSNVVKSTTAVYSQKYQLTGNSRNKYTNRYIVTCCMRVCSENRLCLG